MRRKDPAAEARSESAQAVATDLSGTTIAEFGALYDAHFAFVWRTLKRFGVPERDLADAAQEVFVVVYRKLSEFQGRSKLSTWLFRICFHVGSSRTRRAHLRREILDESYAYATAPDQDPERSLEQRRDFDRLQAILAAMDMDCSAVFCLFELEDMTGEQIAELLEIPLGTVYSRLRKARALVERGMRSVRAKGVGLRAMKERP